MSPVERLAMLPVAARREVMDRLSLDEMERFPYLWREWWARPEQLAPAGDWRIWLYLGGRGTGKTRAGAEWVRERVKSGSRHIAMIAPIVADIRSVLIDGPAGILKISPPGEVPRYEPSKRHRLTWPNGAVAEGFSSDEPNRLRGPQFDAAWCDEIAAWRYPETWDMLMFGLRLGDDPRVMATTTPRPIDLLIGSGKDGHRLGLKNDPTCVHSRGDSYRNRANLAPSYFAQIVKRFEGSRLGRQELLAEILEDIPGALFSRQQIDAGRPPIGAPFPELRRIVVAIDPAVTSGEEADETGIIVVGKDDNGHGYVLADLSGHYAPIEWARVAINAYGTHAADRIVAEVNNGGEMVETTLRMVDSNVPFTAVHASRGKVTRAEPISALYEQGRIHHLGAFPALEDQMCAFTSDFDRSTAGYSPDRVDALVWGFTELLIEAPRGNTSVSDEVRGMLQQMAAASRLRRQMRY